MPPLWTATARMDVTAWPLPPEAVTHPRTAGTFGRALRLWRQEGAPLMEALRRATLLPAEVLEGAVPAMRRKGRVQTGTDADLVVFDEARVTDQATYDASTRPSSGIAHVIVGGTFVVRDGELVPDARHRVVLPRARVDGAATCHDDQLDRLGQPTPPVPAHCRPSTRSAPGRTSPGSSCRRALPSTICAVAPSVAITFHACMARGATVDGHVRDRGVELTEPCRRPTARRHAGIDRSGIEPFRDDSDPHPRPARRAATCRRGDARRLTEVEAVRLAATAGVGHGRVIGAE